MQCTHKYVHFNLAVVLDMLKEHANGKGEKNSTKQIQQSRLSKATMLKTSTIKMHVSNELQCGHVLHMLPPRYKKVFIEARRPRLVDCFIINSASVWNEFIKFIKLAGNRSGKEVSLQMETGNRCKKWAQMSCAAEPKSPKYLLLWALQLNKHRSIDFLCAAAAAATTVQKPWQLANYVVSQTV